MVKKSQRRMKAVLCSLLINIKVTDMLGYVITTIMPIIYSQHVMDLTCGGINLTVLCEKHKLTLNDFICVSFMLSLIDMYMVEHYLDAF